MCLEHTLPLSEKSMDFHMKRKVPPPSMRGPSLLIRAADDGQGGTDLRLICETTGLVCDVKTHSEQVDSRKVCFEPARKRQALTRLSPHERAALGLRQTMSDLECASHHLDMVAFAGDEHVA